VIVSWPPPFVVIAESDSTGAARYEEAVRSLGLTVSAVGNGADALALVLRTPSPALLLANALLPRVDGESVVRYMRAGQIDVPAILLGDSPQRVARLRGLRIHDTDVRSTDVDRPDLRAAVSRMVARSLESSTDAATSEPTVRRRVLDRGTEREALVREWARVERGGRPLGVALLIVDRLKRVSDQYGHTVGDQMLATVEHAIASCQRAGDIAIRWDADDFLVLLPNTDETEARAFAEGVRSALALVRLPYALVVGVTVGTAVMTAGEPLQDTIGRADELLYRAKAASRNLER
jgi:diguanylate cyclase (GGDEF)-like protein